MAPVIRIWSVPGRMNTVWLFSIDGVRCVGWYPSSEKASAAAKAAAARPISESEARVLDGNR